MDISLLIFESHPVQYRAPVYATLNHICPGKFHVIYASDFSLRGGIDPGFSTSLAWDSNLLGGYPSTVLNPSITAAPQSWSSLSGRGLDNVFKIFTPRAILLTSLNYRYDFVAYLHGALRGIPIWLRTETQDHAFTRSLFKSNLRSLFYRLAYSGVSRAFPIGVLNRQHYLQHGLHPRQLSTAHYCSSDRVSCLSFADRQFRRQALRDNLGIKHDQYVVSFFGKLIPKKDPELLLRALPHLRNDLLAKLSLIFVGSGQLYSFLHGRAREIRQTLGIHTSFAGFVNQSQLVDWYLASDVVVLPSIWSGETWGLVVNEAMQAGCSVVVSEAVGCAADFRDWQRVRVIPVGSASDLASALDDLSAYPRSFSWAADRLKDYSVEAAAESLAASMRDLIRN